MVGSVALVTEGVRPYDSDSQRSQVSLHPKWQNQKLKVPWEPVPGLCELRGALFAG